MTTPYDEVEDEEKALAQMLATLLQQGQSMWVKPGPKPRHRGRPNKSPIEELQVLTWYYKVKSLCPPDWSDAQLDRKFVGAGEAVRRKVFERIRRNSWYPQISVERKVDAHTRVAAYLIDAVEQTAGFAGTKALIESPFWTIFGKKTLNLATVRLTLNELLDQYGLVRLEKSLTKIVDPHVRKIAPDSKSAVTGLSVAGVYSQWIKFSLARIPDELDRLMIVGLLLREALLLSYIDVAVILNQIVWDQVEQFTHQPWMALLNKWKFVATVSEYIRRGHVDVSDEQRLYDNASSMAVCGYIVERHSSFLSVSVDPAERDQWAQDLDATCKRLSFLASTLHGPWDE
jgi:hypothetical protein